MSRVNVYLPDDLAADARAAGLNVSQVTQVALRRELAQRAGARWLQRVQRARPAGVTHRVVLDALDAIRQETEEEGPARDEMGPPG